jgi:hypothetical protein
MTASMPAFKKISGSVAFDLNDLVEGGEFDVDPVQDTTYQFNVDPLAYVVKWHKEDFKSILKYGTLGELLGNRAKYEKELPILFDVSDDELAAANAIRSYYKCKLVNLGLRGGKLTAFRRCMYEVITQERSIKKSQFGILYRLPSFYHEDMFMDGIVENSESISKTDLGQSIDDRFEYLGNIARTTRHTKQLRFWFRNSRNQLAAFYVDSKSNSALPVLSDYFTLGKHYRIQDPWTNAVCLVGQDTDFLAYYLGQNYTIKECD